VADAELWPENRGAWRAFEWLAGSRPIGMAAGPIPLSEYAAYFALRQEATGWSLVKKVQLIDRLWLELTKPKET